MTQENARQPNQPAGLLAWIERTGNRLPDPVFIFLWCILAVVIISVIAAMAGVSAAHPTQLDGAGNPLIIEAQSLLSATNVRRLLVEMPATFAGFYPLGFVLVVMLGAGVAERSGLFAAAMSSAVSKAPQAILTPTVALVAMLGNLATDAAYVVLIPLAGVVFAAAGRHPIAGIAAAFAGVSGGFSANLVVGPLDALLFGITEASAETIDAGWDVNIAGNWYFIVGMTVLFLPVIWLVTDRLIEPRLAPADAANGDGGDLFESTTAGAVKTNAADLSKAEKLGLKRAGLAALGIVLCWAFLCLGPGTPLVDESAAVEARLNPLYQSLVAGFFLLFLATGWAYGSATGSISGHRDIVRMMSEAMADLGYYLVLAFAAAHFVALFNWSNLGLIFAIGGASALEASNLPLSVLLVLIILLTGVINLFVGSASAKWALLGPVLVPMLMLIGVSPEMSTAAYRVGDSATNIITPLMPYFPLILIFCQRWQRNFGIGSLAATMLPYSLWLLITGLVMTIAWVILGLPLGPGASVGFMLPGS
ncbi:MAG: AbgT family transporter [Gammaproteobacteria bacterium]|nr:AbgT family transporter [Pseudomonadales bacterium]MCP5346165.1 AbgT family transporter [Pseudomonadales bacterium]